MTEEPRPAPQYGEYATPEEQQEIIRRSGGTPVLPVASTPEPLATPPASASAVPDAATPTRRRDRFITVALLAYGLFTVVTTIPQLIDYSSFADTWLQMAGIDASFTATAEGRAWGTAAALIFAAGWIASALLSWWAIVRGALSWWIPLAGAVVTFTLVSLCLSVPLLSDPAVMEGVLRAG